MHHGPPGGPPGDENVARGVAVRTYLRLLGYLRPHWHWMALTVLLAG